MFNGNKIEELEDRVAILEKIVGGRYSVLPGDNHTQIRFGYQERTTVFQAVTAILTHLGLEFKRTPETLQLVAAKKEKQEARK